jgi:hypothetical protein
MRTFNVKWRLLAVSAGAAICLAACESDNGNAPPHVAPPASISFTTFATNAFATTPNSTPVSLDGITFNFDADDNPTAFDTLVMSGIY